MGAIIADIRQELKANVDTKFKAGAERFFKEKITLYGVRTARVREIGRKHFGRIKGKPKREIFSLCEELLGSGRMEEALIAYGWAHALRQRYEPRDFARFRTWVNRYVSNWAECDTFCAHTLGSFMELFPGYAQHLIPWTRSKNRWVRRASAVTLIIPASRGMFFPEITRISDALLEDPDDLVRKGYGWLLKSASKSRQPEVFAYVMRNRAVMPRTALRYAIELMPPAVKARVMAK